MAAARATSGGAAASSQFDNHADHIDALETFAITTAGTVGAASIDATVGWKEDSGTTSGNGRITVTHHLGWTPSVVLVQLRGDPAVAGYGPYICYVVSPTSTVFTLALFNPSTLATAAGGKTVTFDWIAFKAASS